MSGRGRLAAGGLIAGVVGLAGALVAVAVAAWLNTVRTADEGLRSRLVDRALTVRGAWQHLGDADPARLGEVAEELGIDAGYVHLVDRSGRIVGSTNPEATGRAIHRPLRDERGFPGEPTVVTHEGDLQVWLPARVRGRRGRFRDRREGRRQRLVLVAGLPIEAGREGVATARVHLGVSVAAALALLALAAVGIRASRRAGRLALEMERRQRLAALGQLAAVLAHEIRTPLAAVRGWAQLLAERVEADDTRRREPTDRIVRETDRLGRLVDDLLEYARPAAPSFARTELAACARETVERLSGAASAAGVPVMVDAMDEVLAEVDADRFSQVLDNLVRNAIEASPRGQPVVVALSSDRSSARITVSDRGPGVPDHLKERIFEPFHTGRASGTGLGLAVARRIADEHGGTIDVGDRPGGGAVFTLTVPRSHR